MNINSNSNLNNQNFETSSIQQPYNWLGVLEFLQDQFKEQQMKETEWLLEKQILQEKVAEQEGQIKAHEQINTDLIKRNKMLEFSLRQERMRYNQLLHNNKQVKGDIVGKTLEENQNLLNQEEQLPQIPQRKAKGHRPLLSKILQEVGLEDIFQSTEYKMQENAYKYQSDNLQPENTVQNKHEKQQSAIQKQIQDLEETGKNLQQQLENNQQSNSNSNVNQDNNNSSQQQQQQQQNNSIIFDNNNNNDLQSQNGALGKQQQQEGKLSEKFVIRAHFDGVRDTEFISKDIFVSTSEDCMVKLYNVKQFGTEEFAQQNIDPYLTIRDNSGPVFSVVSAPEDLLVEGKHIFFTGGSEGLIKSYHVPDITQVQNYGPSDQNNFRLSNWNCHEDIIWQIVHHPYDRQLLVSSAEGKISSWSYNLEMSNSDIQEITGKFLQNYIYKDSYNQELVPTSVEYIHTNMQQIASGYMEGNNIILFQRETGQIAQLLQFQSQSQQYAQTNRLLSHQHINSLISAHDDGHIKIFDLNSNKQVANIQAHKLYAKSICIGNSDMQICSVGNDGNLNTWDLRNNQQINTLQTNHLPKYDETIHNVKSSQYNNYITTAGADGNICFYTE